MTKRRKVRRGFPWLPERVVTALAVLVLVSASLLAARALHRRPPVPPPPQGLAIGAFSHGQDGGRWYVEGRVDNNTGATVRRARYVLTWRHKESGDVGPQVVVEVTDLRPGQSRGFRQPVHGYTSDYACEATLTALED